jgi:hypothetical protein
MSELESAVAKALRYPDVFARHISGTRLRRYQSGVCEAVCDSILHQRGLSFVVMFPRQSGKNELQAQLETYLLALFSDCPAEMVKVSPTLKPQAQTAMRRLERTLKKNLLLGRAWHKEAGTQYAVEQARINFLSGAPESSIVGATASLLLEVDEAQDVQPGKFDKDIAPMTASTHATRVFWGTAWTRSSLLGRELHAALDAEKTDGQRRVFKLSADDVSAEVPAYRETVKEAIAKLGRSHPLVRTQYFSEEIDSLGGLFPPDRIARMQAAAGGAASTFFSNGCIYAALLDVAGADEGVRSAEGSLSLANPTRDATALTIVQVLPGTDSPLPVYRPVFRKQWIGAGTSALLPQLRALALEWQVQALVVDATGVGAGLASLLESALPGRVFPFTFNSSSKSKLGWDFTGLVDAERWQEALFSANDPSEQAAFQREFFKQLAACQFEVQPGPDHAMRWSVPDGSRDPQSGELLHDDWVLSAALASVLDGRDWQFSAAPALIVQAKDPLREMDRGF